MNLVTKVLRSKYTLRFMLALLAGFIMFAVISLNGNNMLLAPVWEGALIGAVLCFSAMMPLVTDGKLDNVSVGVAAVGTAALIFLRVCMFYYQSGDYGSFLSDWLAQMRPLSLTEAMKADIGDYNMPYLYILFIISRLKVNDLFAIKAVSCLFDVLAAFFVMKIVSHFANSASAKVTSYLLGLALPTVWLNGAFWGQCDVMFAALCLGMVYFALKNRGIAACIMWALALSLKLQAIFALPALALALFSRRIKPLHLLSIPPMFFATLAPAMLCGRGFMDCIKIYFEQADQYPQMSLNIPSVWSLLGYTEFAPWNSAAIYLTGAAVLTLLYLCWQWRDGIDDKMLLMGFYVGALLIPFLLPRMHDRYYFLADVAALAVFLVDRKKWYLPVVTVLSSYSAYRYFVMGGETLFDLKYFAVALLVVLTITIKDMVETMKANTPKKAAQEPITEDFVI